LREKKSDSNAITLVSPITKLANFQQNKKKQLFHSSQVKTNNQIDLLPLSTVRAKG